MNLQLGNGVGQGDEIIYGKGFGSGTRGNICCTDSGLSEIFYLRLRNFLRGNKPGTIAQGVENGFSSLIKGGSDDLFQ